MDTFELILEIEAMLIKDVTKTKKAFQQLENIITNETLVNLQQAYEPLHRVIELFMPKKKLVLIQAMQKRGLIASCTIKKELPHTIIRKEPNDLLGKYCIDDVRKDFEELSAQHLFQWSSHYRDLIFSTYEKCFSLMATPSLTANICQGLKEVIGYHSKEIFTKGSDYQKSIGSTESVTIKKSTSGLQTFLEIPIEAYTNMLIRNNDLSSVTRYRLICSAFLCGILKGYSTAKVDTMLGAKVLPRFPKNWLHYLGFLTYDDLSEVSNCLEAGETRDNISRSMVPVAEAIDNFSLTQVETTHCYPVLGQFDFDARRINIALQPLPKNERSNRIEINVYLDISSVDYYRIEDDARRDIGIIVAPVRKNVVDAIEQKPELARTIVNVSEDNTTREIILHQIESKIREIILEQNRSADGKLSWNYAKDFPLKNPFLNKYYHVYRKSVKNLLSTFERKNGIRVWCSIRRSGKTTACKDIASATGQYTIVTQTCDNTELDETNGLLISEIRNKIEKKEMLSNDFFAETIRKCVGISQTEKKKIILLLDEYETLFETLKVYGRADDIIRIAIVQPLLNQITRFAQENLVIFIGQRPDAHYIFMDKNQLSPYTEQDSFPLFTHENEERSEFNDFLTRVISDKFNFETGFSLRLYRLTGGHPYLTVNVLVVFFQWLIDTGLSIEKMRLSEDMFESFCTNKLLLPSTLRAESQFKFFREAIGESLSENSKKTTPWLYSIYRCLQIITRIQPVTMTATIADIRANFKESLVFEEKGYQFEELIEMGCRANFFERTGEMVSPRIPILGYLCSETLAKVS